MKKIGIFCLIFLFLASAMQVHAAPVTQQPDTQAPSVTMQSSCNGFDASTAMLGTGVITDNMMSAFLYDLTSDTLMYAYNPDLQVAPASLVKIMTAMLAIREGDPDAMVTVTRDVLSTVAEDAVSADLLPGEQLSLRDLLYCMMVGSANDAAAVIADHISGSQEAFVAKMNAYAAQIGCTGTVFVNPHGLHHENQLTTARDVARILADAMQDELFCEIFGAIRYDVPATNMSEQRNLSSGNFLMNVDNMAIYYDERVTGGRTGVAQDGTRCLAASAEGNGLSLISVVMGAESVYEEDGYTVSSFGSFLETSQLISSGLDGYKSAQILYIGQALEQCPVQNGANELVVGPMVDVTAVLPANVGIGDLNFRIEGYGDLKAPIQKGDSVSTLEVWYGSLCIAQTELFAMNSVASLDAVDTNSGNGLSQGTAQLLTIALIILGVIALCAFTLFMIPKVRRLLKIRRQRQYSKSRRRSR